MRKLVLASNNQGKVEEFKILLEDLDVEVLSLKDFPEIEDIEETGETFLENSFLKAEAVFKKTGLLTLADDSGLEVDYLDKRPGVYSARFAGEEKDDQKNNEKLLKLLAGVPREKRKAQFVCTIALCLPEGEKKHFTGRVEGEILEKPRGEEGFGYDPLFYIEKEQKSFAQLSTAEKNKISHRGKAVAKASEFLRAYFKK